MYGDPEAIRALARRMRRQGEEVRAEAEDLRARARAVAWTGWSGCEMVGQTVAQARLLDEAAGLHDVAARALARHADEVERLLTLIAEIERRVREAMADARHRVDRFVHRLGDVLDPWVEELASFTPPAPGSPDWLHVRPAGVPLPQVRLG